MSNQPPFDLSRPPVSPSSSGVPGASPSEYVPLDVPPLYSSGYPPMQQPAYLYPLPSAYAVATPGRWPGRGLALAGLLVGIGSTLIWFLPCLGYLFALAGMALSILGWRTPTYKWMAMVGCAFSLATVLLGLCDSALGAAILAAIAARL